MKQLIAIHRTAEAHWVGDGFPVRTLFSYQDPGPRLSPFLLLDHAGPARFTPSDRPRGVGQHPHRGFETVTIVYQGEVEHRDSTGNAGHIGPGDVQWMTAAAGILHEEMHGREFTRAGGTLEMVQLWVNLPARLKMSPPRYQSLLDRDIPGVNLANGGGRLRVIAGVYAGVAGPAQTYTPINAWDLRLTAGHRVELPVPDGYTTVVLVLKGKVLINESEHAGAANLAQFEREGTGIVLEAADEATVLVLNGEPIDEPVVGYGPFVMNTEQEIHQAIADFQKGRFGRFSAS